MQGSTVEGEVREFSRQAYRREERRIEELEKLAEQFWPGRELEARNLRAYNVWAQINEETDWDQVEFCPPERDPIDSTPEAIVNLCTSDLEPSIGMSATGFGDHLRAELRRHGTDLEALFIRNASNYEEIPWEDLTPSIYIKTSSERHHLRAEINRNRLPWNRI